MMLLLKLAVLPRLLLANRKKLLCGKKWGMLIKEVEVKTIPPVYPDKARIDALKRQKTNLSKTIKAEKARATINKGQQQLSKALQS